ncbi:methyltransferase domain-containing protein [Shivajiella indica]|uniref:Methyltransferase domain-containing protein n=1 Tax=Shivajiella indica TaxID=872115 RepID=A0ABW5BF20_9BACT
MVKFTTRSVEKEIMDDLEVDGPVLVQTLKELRTINKLLGGNYVTTSALKKIIENSPDKSFTIADIGCGGGDMIRVMANWAKSINLNCHFIGIDANPNTIAAARENLADLKNVSFQVQNVFEKSFLDQKVDIISCTLFTHHFTDKELINLFSTFIIKAKIALVINDLHRHPLAFYSIKLLTALFSHSPMVKNDGPLSVLRSFRKKEIEYLMKASGFKNFEISWHWAFRWKIIAYTPES